MSEGIEVPLHTLSEEQEFVYTTHAECEVLGAAGHYIYGRLLYKGTGTCLVQVNEDGKLHDTRWATDTPVIPVEITDEFNNEELTAMSTATANVNDPAVKALLTRYKFQLNALVNGVDKAKETAGTRLPKIFEDADKAGVHLPHPSVIGLDAAAESAVITDSTHEFSFEPVEVASAPSKAQKDDATQSARKAAVKAAKAEEKAAKPPKAPREKKEKTLNPCLDGCGQMVGGKFAPGHDAKLKSLIYKIERGDEPVSAIPEVSAKLVKFAKGEMAVKKDDAGKVLSKTQLYVCTDSPVKLTGR